MRLSYRADRADLVIEGLFQGITTGRFVDVHPDGPEWGSMTALLSHSGWSGLHLVPNGDSQAAFLGESPSCIAVVAPFDSGTADLDATDPATLFGLRQRYLGDAPLHLLCIGRRLNLPRFLAGAELDTLQAWALSIETPSRPLSAASRCLLSDAGYSLVFEGPTFEVWVAARAPTELKTVNYAAAVVMCGPALPTVLLPPVMSIHELLELESKDFVRAAYWSVLRRSADEGGQRYYEEALRRGRTRLDILRDLALSEEARSRGVGGQFRGLASAGAESASGGVFEAWRRRLARWVRRYSRRLAAEAAPPAPLARLAGGKQPSAATTRSKPIEESKHLMDWPHYKISYAQNFEDLVLAGLLKGVPTGFYVDVGANHPELDSVTKIFYDKGWSGINVEPNDELHRLLDEQRPRDINVKAAASSQPGSLTLRIYDGLDGLSTISREIQAAHASALSDRFYRDVEVPVVCLADMLARHRPAGDIHFLKVDVEGLELEVLLGNDWQRFRPWVMCLERNLQVARQQAIRTFLRELGYQGVFWDGINDFFVADERRSIWDSFSYASDVVMNGVPVNYIFVRTMAALAREAESRG